MAQVVIVTGGTRGIGFGLVREFLKKGCSVAFCGRSASSVEKAMAQFTTEFGTDHVLGVPCDVSNGAQLQALWDAAVARFGRVDIWVNNAGIGNLMRPLWELPESDLRDVIDTNLTGSMLAAGVAIRGMMKQPDGGHFYLMEGFGSSGGTRSGMTPYGSTKAATRYLSKALAKEVKGSKVKVSALSPGIVTTDFLPNGYDNPADFERAKRIFNILGDKVETVTPVLVEKVLANQKSGALIEWLSGPKVMLRFLTAPFNKRDLFAEE